MEYNINEFVSQLRKNMYKLFPYEPNDINMMKHRGRTQNIRDVAFMNNPINYVSEDILTFDIGNDFAEKYFPYYHILEDAPVIRKRGQGTQATKGSQDKISDLSKRDYGIVTFNGKTFSKEYAKNVRGKRSSVVNNATQYVNGQKINKGASSYKNIHYHYIENMLLQINPIIANYFGLKYGRVQSTGLAEDYVLSTYDIKDISSDSADSWVSQILGM